MNILKILLINFYLITIIFHIDPENINKRICIIYDKTKSKINIVNEIEKNLKDKNITIEKDSIIRLYKYYPDRYDAVIILSGVLIFTANPIVTTYIEKYIYKKNIIYYCSTKYEETAYGFVDPDKIDAITSASENYNEHIVYRIMEKLNNILNKNN